MKNGSKLARSTGSSRAFSASSRGRARVAPGGGVRLALRVQPGVGRRSVHRRGCDELAVLVGHEDGQRPGSLADDQIDDRTGLFETHCEIVKG